MKLGVLTKLRRLPDSGVRAEAKAQLVFGVIELCERKAINRDRNERHFRIYRAAITGAERRTMVGLVLMVVR